MSVFPVTPDGRRVFVTDQRDDTTSVLDATTLRVLRSYPIGEDAGAVSADGRFFALGSQDGHVRVLNTATGAVRPFTCTWPRNS